MGNFAMKLTEKTMIDDIEKPVCEACGTSIEKVRQMLKCQCTETPLSVAIDDEEVPDHWPLLDVLEFYTR